MFGYVQPLIPELRVKDRELYQAYYCGLCRCLSKYGLSGRASLTYDATFLSLLLTAVCEDEAPGFERHGCLLHPVRGKTAAACKNAALEYSAALCVLLAKDKLIDDSRDGHPMRKCLLPFIAGAAKRAGKEYPAAAEALKDGLKKLSEIERENTPDADRAPVLFGELMAELIISFGSVPENAKPMLSALSKAIGGFIYTIDAWDDREEDKKRGCYNMFNCIGTAEGGDDALKERASAMLDMYINSAVLAYDLLEIKFCKPLLDNIIYQGLGAQAEKILSDEEGDK